MSEDEKEYTEYVKAVDRSRVTMLSLFAGFSFTAITLFLDQSPDPSSFMAQLVLFFLVVLFDLCLFLLAWQTIIMIGTWNVGVTPDRSKWELSAFNFLMIIAFILWGWSVVLMFLLWNLTLLSIISGGLWAAVIVGAVIILRGMVRRLGWSVKKEFKNIRTRI